MGRAFLRAFVASAVVVGVGVLSAPDLNQMYALGVAAIVASLSAGFKAVQVFVPQLSIGGNYGEIITVALQAGLAAFLVTIVGVLDAPNLELNKATVTGVLVAVGVAILRALQGVLTAGESPAPAAGVEIKGNN